MECPNCKKELTIPNYVYRKLETYSPEGRALTISSCCQTGFIVTSSIQFKITKYTGEETQDNWGNKIKTNK